MKHNTLLSLFFILALTVSCTDGKKGLQEQTSIQSEGQILAQNANVKEWTDRLSDDLDKRRNFINAVEGEFEGEFILNETTFIINIMVFPSKPELDINRTLTREGLENELRNTNVNIQVRQWNSGSQVAVGCTIKDVRPDFKKGILNMVSENCRNTYQIFLSAGENQVDQRADGVNMANQINDGRVNFVDTLKGKLRSNTNSLVINFELNRL